MRRCRIRPHSEVMTGSAYRYATIIVRCAVVHRSALLSRQTTFSTSRQAMLYLAELLKLPVLELSPELLPLLRPAG